MKFYHILNIKGKLKMGASGGHQCCSGGQCPPFPPLVAHLNTTNKKVQNSIFNLLLVTQPQS